MDTHAPRMLHIRGHADRIVHARIAQAARTRHCMRREADKVLKNLRASCTVVYFTQ